MNKSEMMLYDLALFKAYRELKPMTDLVYGDTDHNRPLVDILVGIDEARGRLRAELAMNESAEYLICVGKAEA